MNELKLFEVLKRASLFLEQHGAEPRTAELLLMHHLGMSRNELFMNMRDTVPQERIHAFQADIRKIAETGIPVQHLIGHEDFFGRRFMVNQDVLIPRPETEEVVMEAIRLANVRRSRTEEPLRIADAGTGSGIIAITLALELGCETDIIATDISERALAIAKQNANALKAPVQFKQGNFLSPLLDQQLKLDMIVSNPPYIPESERVHLSRTVADFDPDLALFASENGLAAYREIICQAKDILLEDGAIVFEIGHDQGESVPALIRNQFPAARIKTLKDINGKDRIVTAELAVK